MIDLDRYHGASYISSDDLKSLLDDVEEERQGIVDAIDEAEDPQLKEDLLKELALWDEERGDDLKELWNAVASLPDDDEQCVRDDHMESYLDEMINDCYELPRDLPSFIVLTIDYDALKVDYSEFTLGGNTYWVRNV